MAHNDSVYGLGIRLGRGCNPLKVAYVNKGTYGLMKF